MLSSGSDEPEALILASALAARCKEPLLIYESGDGVAGLLGAAGELGAATVVIAGEGRGAARLTRGGALGLPPPGRLRGGSGP